MTVKFRIYVINYALQLFQSIQQKFQSNDFDIVKIYEKNKSKPVTQNFVVIQ